MDGYENIEYLLGTEENQDYSQPPSIVDDEIPEDDPLQLGNTTAAAVENDSASDGPRNDTAEADDLGSDLSQDMGNATAEADEHDSASDGPGNDTTEADDLGADLSEDMASEYMFFFKAIFYRRLYKNQLKPRELCQRNIGANTMPCLLASIWVVCKKHVNRQVLFDDETPRWSEKQDPTQKDMVNFITLQDPSKRKTYSVNSLTPRIITTWRNKCIKIHVYVYSTSLESNAQYQSVLKKLISPQNPDRAGAHSTRDDSMLAEELRISHIDLEGHHSSWLLWANFINSSPAHKHDELKKAPAPPLELAKYFRWTNVSESARLQAVHRGMTVAHTMNDGWIKEIVEVKKDLDLAMTILEGVNQRVKAMVTRGTMGAELFSSMESAVRPEESEISLNLAANITDCADVDHA